MELPYWFHLAGIVGDGRIADRDTKSGQDPLSKAQPFLLTCRLIAGNGCLGDENTEFISDLKISEPTRRIQGKNHYLFW
jgi:hypothetical protein